MGTCLARHRGSVKCPCLYSEEAPICRADAEAMRIPATEHLVGFCLSGSHRRCTIFREFVRPPVRNPDRVATAKGVGEHNEASRKGT